jgi:hypothetical protein
MATPNLISFSSNSELLRLQEHSSVSSTTNGDQIQAFLKQTNLDRPGSVSSVSLQLLSTAIGVLFCCIGGSAWCTFVLFRRLQDHIRINTDIYELAVADCPTSSPGRADGAGIPLVSHSPVLPSAG